MDIGIGLPATIPNVEGRVVLDWARAADRRGFSTLGVIDRAAYGNYEPLTTLAAAAAVTERIRLTTSILLAPLRTNHVEFAKRAATIDRLSNGRLVLGLAPGGREDDYTVSDVDFHSRGTALDSLVERATAVWRGDVPPVGPMPVTPGGPPLIFGGQSDATFQRVARHGAGWIASGGSREMFKPLSASVRDAWSAAGREGTPRLLALGYFALGANARAAADWYLHDYYAFLGPLADRVAAGALVTTEQLAETIAVLGDAGCDELILFPCDPDVAQVDRLAEAVGILT